MNSQQAAAHEATFRSLGAVSAIVIPGFVSTEWASLEAAMNAKDQLEQIGLSGCEVRATPDDTGHFYTQWEA